MDTLMITCYLKRVDEKDRRDKKIFQLSCFLSNTWELKGSLHTWEFKVVLHISVKQDSLLAYYGTK